MTNYDDGIDWSTIELPPEATQSCVQPLPMQEEEEDDDDDDDDDRLQPQSMNERDNINKQQLLEIERLKAELQAKDDELFGLHASLGA